uniref:SWIRM domain-containing protein n=1 Tax=Steinernema glaseri TaxID=37863 RepID=A0A1I7ZB71_9BILA
LAACLVSPPENTGDRLNSSLVPFDLKIAHLKEVVPVEYHQFIDRYWKNIKRSTIPGLKERCLPENDDTSSLVEKYNTVFDLRKSYCIPDEARPFSSSEIPAKLAIILPALGWLNLDNAGPDEVLPQYVPLPPPF